MRSFQEIVRMANELPSEETTSTPTVRGPLAPRDGKRRVWKQGIARLIEATRQVDRVLEEEGIPHGPPTCYSYRKPIGVGEIRMLHGECDERRFSDAVDLHELKDLARRNYSVGHPVREVVLAMDDRVAKVELPLVAKLIFRLSAHVQ